MQELTPTQVVSYLDRYIVGQDDAKRAVAVALRNRIRRQRLDPDMARDVMPKNIILAGPTGVGKTEIARRLADLVRAPMVKVEATKYTEVGYFGRDVETIVRDLVEASVSLVRSEELQRVKERSVEAAEERLLDLLAEAPDEFTIDDDEREEIARRRAEAAAKLAAGELEDERITVTLTDRSGGGSEVFSQMGVEQMGMDLQGFMDRVAPPRPVTRRMTVAQARLALQQSEADGLIDNDGIVREAIERAEQGGIVFLDELDKVIGAGTTHGPDVSRGGVQRDLLPLVEGCTVSTRYGPVRTEHVLFIAAGAFHDSKPEDLIPELQGRFPLRVNLHALDSAQFLRILSEPKNALTRQYTALLAQDGVDLTFAASGLEEIAALAQRLNNDQGDIGARRLHMVLERLLEPISFAAPEQAGKVEIDAGYVLQRVGEISA
ncbi:MAG: ATP-dependent protease ATPase subunit HslU [Planctomycetota bacterium]